MALPAGTDAADAAQPRSPLQATLTERRLVPPAAARRLRRMGIATVGDLLFHLPRRYDDFSRPMSLRALRERPPEGPVSAVVEIVELRIDPGFRRRVQRTVARLRDDTGEGEAVWFGRRYIERRLREGDRVALSGKVELRGWLPRFQNPEFGAAGEGALHAGRIVPVYRLTAGVTLPWLRSRIRAALDDALPDYAEYLPMSVGAGVEQARTEIAQAVEWVHFPPDFDELERALKRLAFDELFALQLGMVARDRQRRSEAARPIPIGDDQLARAIDVVESVLQAQVSRRRARADRAQTLPVAVTLTDDQRAAVNGIRADLSATRPMMRLLQGDVGSGKTAVAALAMALVADAGAQGALLAPTDLLARQHFETLRRFLEPLGHAVTLLTGSLPAAARREALELIASPLATTAAGGSAGRVVVGTHALVQERVRFADLALVVVDEQHRFGVGEREALAAKGTAPHVLLMTATPIPRTLGQIVHGDLDVSDLRAPPVGRTPIGTAVRRPEDLVRRADGRPGALPLIAAEVAHGRRAFVVVPLVEEDPETAARSVEEAREFVIANWAEAVEVVGLPPMEPRVEVVHGQLRAAERDERMDWFRQGEVDVLVGTTVLEVGVDVPEATVMLIFDADRFGLAQLHQLRGRVGRGEAESYCVLVSERYPERDPADAEQAVVKARLDALVGTQDGFLLAEMDLEQRREGELLGLSQSGLPPFRVASLSRPEHRRLSLDARRLAEELLDERGRLPIEAAALERELTTGWLRRVGAGEVVSAAADTSPADEPAMPAKRARRA